MRRLWPGAALNTFNPFKPHLWGVSHLADGKAGALKDSFSLGPMVEMGPHCPLISCLFLPLVELTWKLEGEDTCRASPQESQSRVGKGGEWLCRAVGGHTTAQAAGGVEAASTSATSSPVAGSSLHGPCGPQAGSGIFQ